MSANTPAQTGQAMIGKIAGAAAHFPLAHETGFAYEAPHDSAGPFVYRLGRQVFNLERGVRFPYGLPLISNK